MIINIEKTVNRLKKAKKEYYEKGESFLTDHEYDKLEEELRKVDPNNEFFKIIEDNTGNIKHDKKMLSLQKTYDLEELKKWKKDKETVSIYKIDGVSCSLIYDDQLVLAKTRGDGIFGKDITEKIKYINLPSGYKGEVRGEVYCSKENFIKLRNEMKKRNLNVPTNERNIVAGLLGRKNDIDLCKFLSFFAFDLIEELDEQDKLKKLKSLKFSIPPFSTDLESFLDKAKFFMDNGSYLIDGVVISYNKIDDKKGYTSKHPKYKMAFKWSTEEAIAKIEDIDWQISKNGILTPVAKVSPVNLSGATISNVTLHNYKNVVSYDLKKDDEIRIIRSGEVIPKFLGVKKSSNQKFILPINCKFCNTKLENDEIRLFCSNDNCEGSKFKKIEHFSKALGIDDLSEKRLKKMRHLVKNEIDLFSLTKEQLMDLDSFQEKLSEKIINNIKKSKNTTIFKFLDALSFELGSNHVTKLLLKEGISSISDLLSLKEIKLKGVKEKREKAYLNSLKKNKKLINDLLEIGFNIEFPTNSLSFVITGKLSKPRKELESLIKEKGHNVSSSVSKETSFLVTNVESNSSKYKKAKSLNIKIITENDLVIMLRENK